MIARYFVDVPETIIGLIQTIVRFIRDLLGKLLLVPIYYSILILVARSNNSYCVEETLTDTENVRRVG